MSESTSSVTSPLTIGELSKRTGCVIETIRYYERIGILPDPPRTVGGHRLYGQGHLKRLFFIHRSRGLGFSLAEVRGLLSLVDGRYYTCAEVKTLTLGHAEEVKQKIADLRKMEQVLKDMASQCEGGEIPECPVIDAFFGDTR